MPVPLASEYYGDPTEPLLPVQVTVGRITMWFSRTGLLVAFQLLDEELVCLEESEDSETSEDMLRVPGQRLARHLAPAAFEKAWDCATSRYLFPKRVGKLRADWPALTADVPLAVLADWLQDHDHERAATILRTAERREVERAELVKALEDLLRETSDGMAECAGEFVTAARAALEKTKAA
jgi:hypothetical protein